MLKSRELSHCFKYNYILILTKKVPVFFHNLLIEIILENLHKIGSANQFTVNQEVIIRCLDVFK